MSRDKWPRRLDDILYRIDLLKDIVKGKQSESDLNITELTAIERHFEIIGEAVNHIPGDIKKQYPQIEWDSLYGMRNIIVHAYDIVLPSVLFYSAVNELDLLQKTITQIKAAHIP